MSVKLLTEHHLEFLSLKGGCTGSSESTLVKMSHCWKSHAAAHIWTTFFLPEWLGVPVIELPCSSDISVHDADTLILETISAPNKYHIQCIKHMVCLTFFHNSKLYFENSASPGLEVIKLEFILRLKIKPMEQTRSLF